MDKFDKFVLDQRRETAKRINHDWPIVGYTLDELGNARVYRVARFGGDDNDYHSGKGGSKRGDKKGIESFTLKSRKEMLFAIQTSLVKYRSMLTLTYPLEYPMSGKEAKTDLNRVLTYLRKIYPELRYFWWFEFQTRGAPHFHVLIDQLPDRGIIARVRGAWTQRMSDAPYCVLKTRKVTNCREQSVKFNGHRKFWEELRLEDGGVRYATRYAMKMRQKFIPQDFKNPGRFWGESQGSPRAKIVRWVDCTDSDMRGIIKKSGIRMEKCLVVPKNIYGLEKGIDANNGDRGFVAIDDCEQLGIVDIVSLPSS